MDESLNPKIDTKIKRKTFSRESIIGLGEDSFRKNYYPELQEKILALEEINLRNKALIEAIPDVLIISDLEGNLSPFASKIKVNNPLLVKILEDEVSIKVIHDCIKEVLLHDIISSSEFQMDYNNRSRYFEVRTHKTELDEILIIVRDMTTRVELENQLRELALIDPLTGIFNRHNFEEELKTFDKSEVENLALLLIDIDGLKIVNDTLGHLAGDNLIKATAKLIQEKLDPQVVISRIGGDEFGIIIKDTMVNQVEGIIDLIKEGMDRFNNGDVAIKLSLSYGYAFHKTGSINTSLMYQEADNNMYQNKLLKSASNRSYVVKSLMKALEVRDYITEGHADRMGELAVKMGKALTLSRVQLDRIELLAKFHDIGKVGIPDNILNKPGRLTNSEFTIMKTHPQIGERIANESGELREIASLILKHHERYDGKGYPSGLQGEEIPIESRIISIVDAFDAMTNNRPYRETMTMKMAFEEIKNCSGSQFDPELVKVFFEVVND